MQSLRVSSASRPKAVAGAIAALIKESGGALEIQAVGAGAVNQAVKALAIARSYVGLEGYDLVMRPEFIEVSIEGDSRTALRLVIESL